MLPNIKLGYVKALAQGFYCGMLGYRKKPSVQAVKTLQKMRLVGNKGRLTANGWKYLRSSRT